MKLNASAQDKPGIKPMNEFRGVYGGADRAGTASWRQQEALLSFRVDVMKRSADACERPNRRSAEPAL